MGLFDSIFGKDSALPKELTAREAYTVAREALVERDPAQAASAYLCCLYTSPHDSDYSVSEDGKCRAWHFDFFLPSSRTLYLVRVEKGKAKVYERPWEKTESRPVEYTFAVYGMRLGMGRQSEPLPVPEDWVDSVDLCPILANALEPYQKPEHGEPYGPTAVCAPAQNLRYLQDEKVKQELGLPNPPENAIAVICSTDELYEEDCFLFYLALKGGQILQSHKFRFPDLFFFGTSADW